LIIIRKKNRIRHILRHEGLLRDVREGKMQGKRPRGRMMAPSKKCGDKHKKVGNNNDTQF